MNYHEKNSDKKRRTNNVEPDQIIWQEDSGDIIWTEDYEDVYKPAEKSIQKFLHERNIPYKEPLKPVYILKEAETRLIRHLESNLRIELGGILFGNVYYDPNPNLGIYTEITAAVAAPDTVGSGSHLEFTSDSWHRIMDYAKDAHPKENIVGWYHSHPNLGVFMSGTDMRTQTAFFHHPWCVSIVCDPVRHEIGYFIGEQARKVDEPVKFTTQSEKSQHNINPEEKETEQEQETQETKETKARKSTAEQKVNTNKKKKTSLDNKKIVRVLLFFLLVVSLIELALSAVNSKLLRTISRENNKNTVESIGSSFSPQSSPMPINPLFEPTFNVRYLQMSVDDLTELKNNSEKYQSLFAQDFDVVESQFIEQDVEGSVVVMIISGEGDIDNIQNLKIIGEEKTISSDQKDRMKILDHGDIINIEDNTSLFEPVSESTNLTDINLGKLEDKKNKLIPLFIYSTNQNSINSLVSSKVYIPRQIVYEQTNNNGTRSIDITNISEQPFIVNLSTRVDDIN